MQFTENEYPCLNELIDVDDLGDTKRYMEAHVGYVL